MRDPEEFYKTRQYVCNYFEKNPEKKIILKKSLQITKDNLIKYEALYWKLINQAILKGKPYPSLQSLSSKRLELLSTNRIIVIGIVFHYLLYQYLMKTLKPGDVEINPGYKPCYTRKHTLILNGHPYVFLIKDFFEGRNGLEPLFDILEYYLTIDTIEYI
jgi:hypothetical protein